MVSTTIAIERERLMMPGASEMWGASGKRKEDQLSLSSRKKQRTSIPRGHPVQGRGY